MFAKSAMFGVVGASLCAALILSVVPNEAGHAASSNATFTVPANDGYGVGECVSSGSSCGKVVADAWCEAQGFARSSSFGVADVEVTGSVAAASDRPISITCGE